MDLGRIPAPLLEERGRDDVAGIRESIEVELDRQLLKRLAGREGLGGCDRPIGPL